MFTIGHRFIFRKNQSNFMKGIAYSVIVIIALLGVLVLTAWSYNQLTSGSKYGGTISDVGKKDIAISKLETAKRFLTLDLTFASQDSSLDVAVSGGTMGGGTFWYCEGAPTPPEPEEVAYALSNKSLSMMNAYIEGLKGSDMEKEGVTVTKYGCVGIYDPGVSLCTLKDSSKCEYFQSTATQGGLIEVNYQGEHVSYSGDLSSDNNGNRFYWIYHKLYKDTKDNKPMSIIADSVRNQCRGPQTMEEKVEVGIKALCAHYEQLFDSHVKCTYEIKCLSASNPTSCLNQDCTVKSKTPSLCYNSASALSGDFDIRELLSGGVVQAQGLPVAGLELKITLTDNKFNIASSKGLQPLIWNIWYVMSIAQQQCRPIDVISD
jgi:hypothetical protein